MPQLAPVNWLFLFLAFWISLIMILSLLWWHSLNYYSLYSSPLSSSYNESLSWSW